MPIDFRTERVNFDATANIVQKQVAHANFSSRVLNAGAAINGWSIEFTNDDHPVLKQKINILDTQLERNGNSVSVPVEFLLRDNSGNIDDPFKGYVDVMFVAEVA
jgi:hypothetical protein